MMQYANGAPGRESTPLLQLGVDLAEVVRVVEVARLARHRIERETARSQLAHCRDDRGEAERGQCGQRQIVHRVGGRGGRAPDRATHRHQERHGPALRGDRATRRLTQVEADGRVAAPETRRLRGAVRLAQQARAVCGRWWWRQRLAAIGGAAADVAEGGSLVLVVCAVATRVKLRAGGRKDATDAGVAGLRSAVGERRGRCAQRADQGGARRQQTGEEQCEGQHRRGSVVRHARTDCILCAPREHNTRKEGG